MKVRRKVFGTTSMPKISNSTGGEKPANLFDKDYPKTLNIESNEKLEESENCSRRCTC